MTGGITNPSLLSAIQLATTSTSTIVAGAAGYIDTDVSAITGTDTRNVWIVQAIVVAAQLIGARAHGDTADPKLTNTFGIFLCRVDASGHMDLYRNAGNDVAYKINGYLMVR